VVTVAIAIGSNVGDRASHLAFARTRLGALLANFSTSTTYETEPQEIDAVAAPQPAFLNAAATGETDLSAGDVLATLLAIERDRGRQRPFPRAPRTLDLDLILYGNRIVDEPGLTVPHPRFRTRRFVLEPLAEIAPDLRDPVTGSTVAELWALVRDRRG
jgi:2-amino-4-hydroxy-6-hydroxymethyldihydropteridine diphosphokinase